MRGAFVDQGRPFSYIAPEPRVPANHPLRDGLVAGKFIAAVSSTIVRHLLSAGCRRRRA